MSTRTLPRKDFGALRLQIASAIVIVIVWELLGRSGYFFQDVLPSVSRIAEGIYRRLSDSAFFYNLGVTGFELAASTIIGCTAGIAIGIVLGSSSYLSAAFERYFYYLGTTPKIVFFPIIIMWFGIGPASKVAMGSLACLLPAVLSTAAGVRTIDPVLIKVGKSFNARPWDIATKIILPAIRQPVLNGVRVGVALALVSILLAETKLSNKGVGFMIIDYYTRFDMPSMYAMLLIVFAIAAAIDAGFRRLLHSKSRLITE